MENIAGGGEVRACGVNFLTIGLPSPPHTRVASSPIRRATIRPLQSSSLRRDAVAATATVPPIARRGSKAEEEEEEEEASSADDDVVTAVDDPGLAGWIRLHSPVRPPSSIVRGTVRYVLYGRTGPAPAVVYKHNIIVE